MMTGAEVLVRCLEAEGIDKVFGYPGVTVCPLFDAIYDSDIRLILVRQEQNGGHMASGCARVLKKPSVCIATSGPGATNLITALGTAYADSIPIVAITGQVSTDLMGRDVFQEADITGSAEPFVKYSYVVRDAKDLPRIIKEAFHIASTGRQGPVLIDLPIDIQQAKIEYKPAGPVNIRGYKPTVKGNSLQIKKVIDTLKKAKKPLICVGGGTILGDAEAEVRLFAELHGIPVVSTMMGIGVMPTSSPLYLGMLGENGKPYANYAVSECDVFMLVGARVANRAVVRPYRLERRDTAIIHIDVDPAEIGKNLGTTIPLVGDVKTIFSKLLEFSFESDYSEWNYDLTIRKAAYTDKRTYNPEYVDPRLFVRTLSEKMEDDAIYLADVGENQLWSAENYVMKSGRFMTSGGFGTMGYSLPAALGVRAAFPDRQVVTVCGDGSFQMSLMELATMQQWDLPVKIVIMRNGYLGLVREYQHRSYKDRYIGVKLDGSPDFEKLAAAYGIDYFYLRDNSQMDERIDSFLKSPGAAIMVCEVYPYDSVKE